MITTTHSWRYDEHEHALWLTLMAVSLSVLVLWQVLLHQAVSDCWDSVENDYSLDRTLQWPMLSAFALHISRWSSETG